jgi:4a-hydroxytetrahydrobiopterin dehydratase
MKLAERHCEPCTAGGKPLSQAESLELIRQTSGWVLKENQIEREFKFKNFRQAMDFVNEVADIAEEQGHHPDIYIYYNRVRMTLSTHKIGGLSHNDFILAAKIDEQVGAPQPATL